MVTKTKIIAFGLFLTLDLLGVAKSSQDLEAFAQSADPSLDCLSQAGPTEVVSGFFNSKFEPTVAPNKKFDARNASFEIPKTISHSMITLEGSGDNSGMCWAGGYVTASLSWHDLNISWDQSKHGNDGDDGTMNNTTSATCYENRMTWTGMHVYNVHDGIRTSNTYNNWTVQHVWFDYIRDDCIENDHIYSGTVNDSLFDGCYSGISVRPSSSGVGAGETITMDKVLLRMEPMPYPYKWDTKNDPTVTVGGYGNIPFGYGNVFKMAEGNEPDFKITNSVFLLEYNSEKVIFPPRAKVSVCSNNTIIWLGDPADAPTYLLNDFPDCFTIITDKTEGKDFWKNKVADWHARHPEVGANRKPAKPGEYSWPRFPPDTAPEGQKAAGVDAMETGQYVTTGKGQNVITSFVLKSTFSAGDAVVFQSLVVDNMDTPLNNAKVEITIDGAENCVLTSGESNSEGIAEAIWKTSAPQVTKVKGQRVSTGGTAAGLYNATISNVITSGYVWDSKNTSTTFEIQ